MSTYTPVFQPEEAFSLLSDPLSIPGPDAQDVDGLIYDLTEGYKQRVLRKIDDASPTSRDSWHERRIHQDIETLRHRYALRCLKDVRSSAALIKELAFAEPPLNPDGTYHAVDLGTGTGILSVGTAIAGLRSGAQKAVLHMVDIEEFLLGVAVSAVDELDSRLQCIRYKADITEPALYAHSLPLQETRFWVTETISQGLPPVRILQDRVFWTERGTHDNEIDPFPEVIHQIVRHVPDLARKVRSGETRFFPDLFREDFIPGEPHGLRLKTSRSHATHGTLGTVGADFLPFDDAAIAGRW